MNILEAYLYGYHKFALPQAKEYVRQGHRVRMIVFHAFGKKRFGHNIAPFLDYEEDDGVEVYYLRMISLSHIGEKIGFNDFSERWFLKWKLSRILQGFQTDVMCFHALDRGAYVAPYLKKKIGCPAVLTVHGTAMSALFRAGRYELIRERTDCIDVVTAVSVSLEQQLIKAGVKSQTKVILNGSELKHAYPAEKKAGSVVMTASLIPDKCADITLRAFAKIHQRYPFATLTIVGEGSEEKRLKDLCKELGLSSAVCFTGQLPNKEVFTTLAHRQFFVMPSINEGFGIVYLEAMVSKCVTIGTQGEGIDGFLQNGKNGFLVPPKDPDEIAAVITWCMEHPEEAERIAEQGRQDALELTWEKNAEQYLALFQMLL